MQAFPSIYKNALLQNMCALDLALLTPHLVHCSMPRQMGIERCNTGIPSVYFIENGVASIVARHSGRDAEMGLIGSEGMTGAAIVMGTVKRHMSAICSWRVKGCASIEPLTAALSQQPDAAPVPSQIRSVADRANRLYGAGQCSLQHPGTLGALAIDVRGSHHGRPPGDNARVAVSDAGHPSAGSHSGFAGFGRVAAHSHHTRPYRDRGPEAPGADRIEVRLWPCQIGIRATDGPVANLGALDCDPRDVDRRVDLAVFVRSLRSAMARCPRP